MESELGVRTCLLCNLYYDRKPVITPEKDYTADVSDSDFVKFRLGLTIFWRVLKRGRSQFEGGGSGGEDDIYMPEERDGEEGVRNGHPCCGECYMVLVDLVRLEEIIRETQAQQREIVNTMKLIVEENQFGRECQLDNAWTGVRTQLVNGLNSVQDELENAVDDDYSSQEPPSSDLLCEDNSHVITEPESESGMSFRSSSQADDWMSTPPETSSSPQRKRSLKQKEPKRKRGRTKLSNFTPPARLKASEVPNTDPQPEPEPAPLPRCLRACSISLERIRIEDFPELSIGVVAGRQPSRIGGASERPRPARQQKVAAAKEEKSAQRKIKRSKALANSRSQRNESNKCPVGIKAASTTSKQKKRRRKIQDEKFEPTTAIKLEDEESIEPEDNVPNYNSDSDSDCEAPLQEDENIDGVEVELYPGEVERDRNEAMKLILGRFHPDNLFYLLSDNLVLHNNVLLKFTPNDFTCQEPRCGTTTHTTDYDAFEFYRKHVKCSHENPSKEGKTCCPVCLIKFNEDGGDDLLDKFKRHIFQAHSPPAICVSCLEPIHQPYDQMEGHALLHMNSKERAKIRRRWPPVVTANRRQLYKCKTCRKIFLARKQRDQHEKVHLPAHLRKRFKCPQCGNHYLTQRSLELHTRWEHEQGKKPERRKKFWKNGEERKRRCPICGREYKFQDSVSFDIHMKSHTGETPFICEVCGKGFPMKHHLKRHTSTVHSDARPFQCEFCEMCYKHSKNLKLHQKIVHKDLVEGGKEEVDPQVKIKRMKPEHRPGFIGPKIAYPCPLCGKLYHQNSRLKRHLKSKKHTQSQPKSDSDL